MKPCNILREYSELINRQTVLYNIQHKVVSTYLSHQTRYHMPIFHVEVIVRTIDISRNHSSKVTPILLMVYSVHDVYHALGHGIPIIGVMRTTIMNLLEVRLITVLI